MNLPSAVFLQSSQAEIVTDFKNKSVLICADRQGFPKSDKLVDYIKGKFPASEELMIDKRKVENEDVLSKLSQGYDIYFFIGHSKPNLKFPDLTNIQLTPLRKNDKMPIQ
nr:hypothetical protein [Nitrosopumilaceae archaeon]NIX61759.1 hypothetical protein [Nitrosopumilaceae archaeon]